MGAQGFFGLIAGLIGNAVERRQLRRAGLISPFGVQGFGGFGGQIPQQFPGFGALAPGASLGGVNQLSPGFGGQGFGAQQGLGTSAPVPLEPALVAQQGVAVQGQAPLGANLSQSVGLTGFNNGLNNGLPVAGGDQNALLAIGQTLQNLLLTLTNGQQNPQFNQFNQFGPQQQVGAVPFGFNNNLVGNNLLGNNLGGNNFLGNNFLGNNGLPLGVGRPSVGQTLLSLVGNLFGRRR